MIGRTCGGGNFSASSAAQPRHGRWGKHATAEKNETHRLMTVGENDPEGQARLDALPQGLNQLGWMEGKDLAIEYRWAGIPG
jgi:hypothetical protein